MAALALLIACAGIVGACSRGNGQESATTAAKPKEVLPPTNFTARAKAMTATLRWGTDPEGAPAERFQIFRNGRKRADLGGTSTSYEDTRVVPGKKYKYEIRTESGGKQSEKVAATVTTRIPPLRTARLEGLFTVNSKVTSSSGFASLPENVTYGWRFLPKCPTGSCRVVWTDRQTKAKAPFAKSKVTYEGSYTGVFGIRCGSSESTSSVQIEIEVTHARAILGVWRATRFRGTLSTSDYAQLGCVSSRKTEAIIGRFVQ